MDITRNEVAEYQYRQQILITTGFYKGYKGIIDSFNPKDKIYTVILEIKDRKISVQCKESDIHAVKGIFH